MSSIFIPLRAEKSTPSNRAASSPLRTSRAFAARARALASSPSLALPQRAKAAERSSLERSSGATFSQRRRAIAARKFTFNCHASRSFHRGSGTNCIASESGRRRRSGCNGSIRVQGGVEDVKQGGIPASAGSTSLQRIPTIAYNPPSISRVTNSSESVERVEQRRIARFMCSRHRSSKCPDDHRYRHSSLIFGGGPLHAGPSASPCERSAGLIFAGLFGRHRIRPLTPRVDRRAGFP